MEVTGATGLGRVAGALLLAGGASVLPGWSWARDAAPLIAMANPAQAAAVDLPAEILAKGIRSDVGSAGSAPDAGAAARDYELAAALGDPDAELNLGVMQDSGVGVPVDRPSAATWYARAASHGQARAAYDLALLYEEGDGVPKSAALAGAWFRAAAAGGIRAAIGRRVAQGADASAASAPLLQSPGPQAVANDEVELVWTPGPGGAARPYWVEVVRASNPLQPVVWTRTDLSAMLVRLPPVRDRYAWRVLAVSPGDGHYARSGWRRFSTESLDGSWGAGG